VEHCVESGGGNALACLFCMTAKVYPCAQMELNCAKIDTCLNSCSGCKTELQVVVTCDMASKGCAGFVCGP
jgi:hypothetical protein